ANQCDSTTQAAGSRRRRRPMTVPDSDEGRHEPTTDPLWNESWYFDFATPDGALGGYVRLGLYPNQRTAWYWAYLVGEGRPLVAVRDHSWGPRDWWTMPWCWTAGRLGDGTAFHAFRPLVDIPFASGFVLDPSGNVRNVETFTVDTEVGAEGLPVTAAMDVGGLQLS